MTEDGHPPELPESSRPLSGAGGRLPDEPFGSDFRRPDRTGGSTPGSSDRTDRSTPPTDRPAADEPPADGDRPAASDGDRPAVDELEARLHQKDAALQNVIDRYEEVLEERRAAEAGRGGSSRRDGLIEAARSRLDTFLTDVEIVLRRR